MPRGGKRAGAGRKPFDLFDPVTEYLVTEFNKELLSDRERKFTQMQRLAKKEKSEEVGSLEVLHDYYDDINLVPVNLRPKLLQNPSNTVLEDIRFVLDNELKGLRGRNLAPLTKAELGLIYSRVAMRASAKFGKPISHRQAREQISKYKRLRDTPF